MMFNTERVGLENMPEFFDTNTRELYYLILFLNDEFWDLLCTNKNLYVSQVKALHPNSYFKELQVCQCATGDEGPRWLDVEDGHQASVRDLLAGHNFMSFTLFFFRM